MIDYVIAAVLILVGVYFVFIRDTTPSHDDLDLVVDGNAPAADGEGDQDSAVTKKVNVAKTDVSNLEVPANFPQEIEIYFGSQTGTAEKFSRVLEEEASDMGVIAKVVDMEDFDKEEFKHVELAIIIAATHGEGDPTDNALRMHTWLKKSAKAKETDMLKGVNYTVFALGDTEYEKFCAAGKFFDEKLGYCGAQRVFKLGTGDTSEDLEGDFAAWKTELWPGLIEHWKKLAPQNGSVMKKEVSRPKVHKDKYPLLMAEPEEEKVEHPIGPLCIRQYVTGKDVKIDSMRECRQTDKYGSCLEVIYDLEGTGMTYNTAANLAVFPENNQEDVDRVCSRFGLDKNQKFIFKNPEGDTKTKHPFPTPCTIGEALTKYCELRGPVDRKMFKDLSQYSKDDSEKQELERLSQNDATEEIDHMKKEFKNIIEVMEEHKSIEMSAAVLLQLLPKMMPRYYTIASSALLSPTKVRIAISLSEYTSPSGKKFTGITSEYLKRVFTQSFQNQKGEVKSRIFIKDSLFKYPEDPKTPVVMVGPGTGVVPFIAFSEERQHLKEQTPDIELGEADLYFGCKERTEDYIYKDEIADFKSKGLISNVYEAFSREQENKVYVQDLIKQNQHEIKDVLMNKNGQFFMCGATAMGHSVETALEDIFGEGGKDYLKQMKDEKRFAKELWSA